MYHFRVGLTFGHLLTSVVSPGGTFRCVPDEILASTILSVHPSQVCLSGPFGVLCTTMNMNENFVIRNNANTARRLLFIVRRSFCELSKTAFTPLYCALVRPHLEYAMEANGSTLRADISHLERVEHLATRLVRGLLHVPYEERLHQLYLFSLERRHLRADLILASSFQR